MLLLLTYNIVMRKGNIDKTDITYEPGFQCPKCYKMLIPSFISGHVCDHEKETPKVRKRRENKWSRENRWRFEL